MINLKKIVNSAFPRSLNEINNIRAWEENCWRNSEVMVMMICRTPYSRACTSSLRSVLFISWQMVHGHTRWSYSSSRHMVHCKWPVTKKFKVCAWKPDGMWSGLQQTLGNTTDSFTQALGAIHILTAWPTAPHLYICLLDITNKWKNAVTNE